MTVQPADWEIGTGVAGLAWEAELPRGVVLLQHGYAEHARRYVDGHGSLVPRLLAAGFSIRAIDLRGHGRSPGRRGEADMFDAVEDHIAARSAISRPGPPIILFGHSLGGLVTAASVVREPSGIAAAVLSAPALHSRVPMPLRALARVLGAVAPGMPLVPPQDPARLSRRSDASVRFRRDPLIHRGWMPARTAATTLALQRDGWRRYAGWRAPTLILHGDDDSFTDVDGSRRFARTIRSADHRLVVVPGGRHELLDDPEGEASMTMILQWLAARLA